MSKGINQVVLLGRLGGDPDVKCTDSGVTIATLNLATNRSVKNKQTGDWDEVADWHRVVFFNRTAEVCEKYLHKGDQISVIGRIQTRSWEDKQSGETRYMTEVIGNELILLGSKDGGGSRQGGNAQGGHSGGKGSGRSRSSDYAGQSPVSDQNDGYEEPYKPPQQNKYNIPGNKGQQQNTPQDDRGFGDDVPF